MYNVHNKAIIRKLFIIARSDCRSIMGCNLRILVSRARNLQIINKRDSVPEICNQKYKVLIKHANIPYSKEYRVPLLMDLVGIKNDNNFFEQNFFM